MIYTIKQAAQKTNLTVHTLRYYDKEELLPFVERDAVGNRFFTENDMEWIGLICCLKNTGMPIKQIKRYIQWCFEGDHTLKMRKQMFIDHRSEVLRQIDELKQNLTKIEYKIAHYDAIQVQIEDKSCHSIAK